jgi:2-polyprenyl-3-methyl-5-hydroxy-6-metoxy-1,4-benzoquinol methylase
MNLVERSSHFEFGENWKDYSKSIDKTRVDQAVAGIQKLFPEGINGKTFLDIGSGSGLHSLAALMLGAKSVTSIDIDENSIEATRALLTSHAPGQPWTAEVVSVFNVPKDMNKKYDIVYSWGVLHHTGDMWQAIERASELVKDGGQFCLAIYASTRSERFWINEKARKGAESRSMDGPPDLYGGIPCSKIACWAKSDLICEELQIESGHEFFSRRPRLAGRISL